MTSQELTLRSDRAEAMRRTGAPGFIRGWAAVVAEWRRREQNREAFRRWISQDRGLRDMGENEASSQREGLFLPLGHFGFVSLGLANLSHREPWRALMSRRLRR